MDNLRRWGVPAVILHGATHSYRRSTSEAWKELMGAASMRHDAQRPYGIERVAPDHPKIKSVTRMYEKTAQHPAFRFFGGVEVGGVAVGGGDGCAERARALAGTVSAPPVVQERRHEPAAERAHQRPGEDVGEDPEAEAGFRGVRFAASTAAAAVGRRGSALTPNLVSSTPVQPRPMRAPMESCPSR